ncbi:MAG: tRNA adenosine(34) deaminase TadA [Desulfobacterales bacterium]|nr:tRNA adenosine(34) deaminase TadA [Desulfobacterales bacterium]
MTETDEKLMILALAEARTAAAAGEVPVGAVLASAEGQILAWARNRTIEFSDPTAHAEILALRQAAKKADNYRLTGTVLVSTIEPCMMCMGALVHARVGRIVYGAADDKWGAAGSLYDFSADPRLNHRIEVVSGVMAEECRSLIRNFFKNRRKTP